MNFSEIGGVRGLNEGCFLGVAGVGENVGVSSSSPVNPEGVLYVSV